MVNIYLYTYFLMANVFLKKSKQTMRTNKSSAVIELVQRLRTMAKCENSTIMDQEYDHEMTTLPDIKHFDHLCDSVIERAKSHHTICLDGDCIVEYVLRRLYPQLKPPFRPDRAENNRVCIPCLMIKYAGKMKISDMKVHIRQESTNPLAAFYITLSTNT